jgi:predicted nucleotidyltransferase
MPTELYTSLTVAQFLKAQAFLKDTELDNNIDVIYATDVGSIAYGLNFPECPLDIRFVYRSKDIADHFMLKDKINQFSARSHGINATGFNVTKALSLGMRSDPLVVDMLQSQHIYKNNKLFYEGFSKAMLTFCPQTLARFHYNALNRIIDERFKGVPANVTSTYIDAIYHAMAIKWLIKSPHIEPPLNLQELIKRDNTPDATSNLLQVALTMHKEDGNVTYSSPTIFSLFKCYKNWAPKLIDALPTKQPNLDALRDVHYKTILG